MKCAAEGAQACLTAEFEDSQQARAAAAGVPAERQGRGIAEQVALARRESPHRGRRHLALARALREDLTCTGAALRAGRITEYRAWLIATETSHLAVEDRMIVDATLAGDPARIEAMGDRETTLAARKLAAELDVEAACRRRRRAEGERRVTIRPAPDTMTWVTALLPVAEGVAGYAALAHTADAARASGDPRTRGQVMADTLCVRVAGQGLCQGCNHAKQAPGWTSHPVADVPGHQIQTTTPTGHHHRSRAPALARPPYRQTRPHVWTLAV